MHACCDKPGNVRHVDHEPRVCEFRDLCHAFEVNAARIGRAARDQHRWPDLSGLAFDGVVVEESRVAVDAVVVDFEPLPRDVGRGPVAEVSAGGEVEAQDAVSWRQQREEHRLVRPLCQH